MSCRCPVFSLFEVWFSPVLSTKINLTAFRTAVLHSTLPPWNMPPWVFPMGQKLSSPFCYTLVIEKTLRHTVCRICCEPQKKHVSSLLENVLLVGVPSLLFLMSIGLTLWPQQSVWDKKPLQDVWVYGSKIAQELAERASRCRQKCSKSTCDSCYSWAAGGVCTSQRLHRAAWHLLLWEVRHDMVTFTRM